MKNRRTLLVLITLLLTSLAQSQVLHFAWLSDTHVGSGTGADDLVASVRDINSLPDIDFVILSGDITEYGSDDQLQQAKSILDGLKVPYHIIPGNHDTKWSESGATEFKRLWGDDKFDFEAGGFRFLGMHEGPIMRMGDGQFSPEDVRWLDSTTSAMPTANEPIIFVTHYPLDQGIANWYVVLDRLKKLNTQAVLVGHGHRNRIDNYEGIAGVMGRSNLRARDSVGGYNIVLVKDDTMSFCERHPGGQTGSAWYRLRLAPPLADSATPPRPDFSLNAEYPSVQPVWTRETGYTIAAAPECADDVLVIGNASGTVYGLSVRDGSTLWTVRTGGPVYSTAAIADGNAVFGSADGKLRCVDVYNGSLRWEYTTGAPLVACPTVDHGIVYCGGSDGIFRAVNIETGKLVWQFEKVGGFVETRPLVSDGVVIFGAWDGHLYALDQQSGVLQWTWTGNHPGVLYSPAACWPVASHGRVFIVAPDRVTTCIDIRTGKQVWRTGMVQARETIGMSDDGSLVYVRSMQDSIVAFRTQSSVPELAWATNAGFGYDINSAMIQVRDGLLTYPTKDGLLISLEPATGKILWKHRCVVGMVQTPFILENGSVALSAYNGEVMVLRP
jgi:outer membrane protein assembly factor BamB/predicted phosphodiesterase